MIITSVMIKHRTRPDGGDCSEIFYTWLDDERRERYSMTRVPWLVDNQAYSRANEQAAFERRARQRELLT